MKPIVRVLFGSRLYGTALPTSDTDYKSVYVPGAEDILLQNKVARSTVSLKTKAVSSVKNTAADVDDESFSLIKFFQMLEAGESLALEVLFAPNQNIIMQASEWAEIQSMRSRLLTKNCKGFVAYCQRQAARYGIRGSRVAATRAALDLVENAMGLYGTPAKLGAVLRKETEQFVREHEHTCFVDIDQPRGEPLRHWNVCDRKMPYTITLMECYKILKAMLDNYGQRALAAEKNEGIDWKAVSHAVRVGRQAIELLSTGHLTFPRPDAENLKAIRRGEIPYVEVQDQLEFLLARVEDAAQLSKLPDTVDRALMDSIIAEYHADQIDTWISYRHAGGKYVTGQKVWA